MLYEENGRESLEKLLRQIMSEPRAEQLAGLLMERYGTLYSAVESLELYQGEQPVPESIRTMLEMTPQLCRQRRMERMGPHPEIRTLADAEEYVSTLYIGAQYEQLYILCLDGEYRLIESCLITEGNLNEVAVYLRRVMLQALRCGAKAIIVCHNHPSGWMFFSEMDIVATRAILSVCAKMQIALIDHLLVARDRVTSMRSRVYIPGDMWMASGPMALPVAKWRRPQPDDGKRSDGRK